ncbi:lytic transglycosylase domain-containing protein [Nocardia sp. MW-W600-9]
MATYSAGEASVKITPDFRKFVETLRGELEKVDAKLGVEIEPDTSTFATDLETELAKIQATVDVDVEVTEASLTAAEARIREKLDGITVSVDVDADTASAAARFEVLRTAYSRMTMDVDANTTAAGLRIEALRAAHETHTMDVDADTTAAAAQLAALQSTLGRGSAGGGSGLLGAGILNAGALGIAALPAAASLIASIGADVQTLGANIALLPGLFAGAAAGAFTLSVGLDNMKDAFSSSPKKAAKAYEQLSAEGKRVVDTLKGFGPEWDRIKDRVQDTTLVGLSEPIANLTRAQLPMLDEGMNKVARSLNVIAKTGLGELSSPRSTAATATIFGNTAEAAGKLNGAVVPIISSIRTLATTGSSFLPRLTDSLTKAATTFDGFITRSANSGQLWIWMDRGITSAGQLMSVIGNLGSSLSSIFRARRGEGETFLTTVDRLTERMSVWLKSNEGQAEMRTFFQEGADQLERWKPILSSVGSLMGTAYEAAQAWSGILLPFLTAASSLLSSHDGIVKTLLISYLAFRTIAPIFGLLQGAITGAGGALSTFQAGMANSSATSTMGKALGGLGAMLGAGGIFGIALIGATVGLGLLAQSHQKAAQAAAEQKRKLEELKGTLDEQTGAITEQTRQTVVENLQKGGSVENGRNVFDRASTFGYSAKEFLDAGLTDTAGRARINQRLTQEILSDDAVGGSWWSLAQSQTKLSDTEIAQALQGVPEALEKYRQAAGDSGVTLAELKRQLGDTAESAATLGGELNNTNSTLGQARKNWQQGNDAMRDTWGLTEEGRRRFEELGLAVTGVPNAKMVEVQTNSPEQIQKLKELGYQVEELPYGVVKITLDDAAARAQIAQITKPETKLVTVNVNGQIGTAGTAAGPGQEKSYQSPESYPRDANGNRLPGRALGGPITGGIPGKDSVPILGMPGEHMLTTSDVDKLGGQSGVYRFRAALQAGLIKPMAKGGAVEWTEKQEIDLQQALTAVTQAEEAAAKVEAKAGASEADKRQARLKVEEARYKAQQLENKKNGTASATTVAPQAASPGRASTADLERADAEAAVDQANAKRNQVYNDPSSTDADKLAADRAYQKAQNSLESTNASSSSSSSSTGIESYSAQSIGAKAGEIIATGILSFFGLENSILSSSNTYNKALNTAVDYYSGSSSSSSSSTPTGDYSYTPKEVAVEDGTSSSSSSKSSGSDVTYSADGGVEQWRGTFAGVLDALAKPASVWLDLGLAQMRTESGGNPNAQNNSDSNAAKGTPSKGLMQVIDPTFASYRSSLYPNDIWNPGANIAAAVLYTQARYGSPAGVWGQGRGYAAGGWVTGGVPGRDSVDARLMPDEFVVAADPAQRYAPLLEAINAGQVPSLPTGFGAAASSSTSTRSATYDRSVNYHGDNYVMNPEELFRQQDRHVEMQSMGPLAAFS